MLAYLAINEKVRSSDRDDHDHQQEGAPHPPEETVVGDVPSSAGVMSCALVDTLVQKFRAPHKCHRSIADHTTDRLAHKQCKKLAQHKIILYNILELELFLSFFVLVRVRYLF